MSANIKWNIKSNEELKKYANDALFQVRVLLNRQRESNAREIKISVSSVGHGLYPFGSASKPTDYIDFQVSIGNTNFTNLGEYDVNRFFSMLESKLNTLTAIKGFETLTSKKQTIYPYVGGKSVEFDAITNVYQLANIPTEFETLNKLISKYCNATINPNEWYAVDLSGKRGTYGESGAKHYHCYSADTCKSIIDAIRQHKTSRDSIKIDLVTYDDIDTEYSRRYETECYGSRNIELQVQIITPKGKIKLHRMF